MLMFGGLEAQSEINRLLDEIFGDLEWASPGEEDGDGNVQEAASSNPGEREGEHEEAGIHRALVGANPLA